MPDPRIQRTRDHVLETARSLLSERSAEPLTFTTLAAAARVSRRTLYTHWGTVERVIADAVAIDAEDEPADVGRLTGRLRLRAFLRSVRDGMAQPVTSVAIASLINQATHNAEAGDSLAQMGEARMGHFRERIAPITGDQYLQLVGPLFAAQFLARETASDALVDQLVERGVDMLHLDG